LSKNIQMTRKYDIILFGATGFTGNLVAQYLSKQRPLEKFTWAIAGRNKIKLESLCHELLEKPDIIIADITNTESIMLMTTKAKVLMNTVGPFNRYGKNVVEACIHTKTHYLDITGEPSFIADIYNSFYQIALDHQTCIINCCGFDSIPADFAAYLTIKKMPIHEPKILTGFVRTNATFSGGTITTAIEALYRETKNESIKVKLTKHPNAPKIKLKIHKNNTLNVWAIPMPVVDPHIVKRSAFRMKNEYGEAFSYGQYFVRSSFVKVLKTLVPIIVTMFLVRFKFFRNQLFNRYKSGTGPDKNRRAASRFEFICFGKSTSTSVKTIFSGGDPGYDETAKMFSESAFTLLNLHHQGLLKFGVLTPVEALGMPLIERLKNQDMKIETILL
jgi:short subunit dehydrogenase-like uncharacterized protein